MEKLFDLPALGPLLLLLKSRKFWVALGTLVIDMVVAQVPELEPIRGELIAAVSFLGAALVASIAHEDAAAKRE